MNNRINEFQYFSKIYFYYLYILLNIILFVKATEVVEDLKNVIVIPFKYYYPKINEEKQTNQENIINSWLRQKLYLTMENEEGQKSSMILTLEQIESHTKEDIALISSDEIYTKLYKENINDICSFNYENSKNFLCQTAYNIFMNGRDKCCIAEEKFVFYSDEKLTKKIISPFKFIHTINKTNVCFFGSLQRYMAAIDQSKSFIDQLKILSGAKTYTWSLRYKNIDSGIFIFGDIINNEKIIFDEKNKVKNIEDNYESIYSLSIMASRIYWKMFIDNTYFGDDIICKNIYMEIDPNVPFILLKKETYNIIKAKIFEQYLKENICQEHSVEYKLSSITCNKKKFLSKTNKLKNISPIIFQDKKININITFAPNDFFRIENDDIYLLIVYNSNKDSQITIGSIFLNKYHTVFNVDSKHMKIFKNTFMENKISSDGNGLKIFFIVFLTIILSGIVFGFFGLKYGKKIYQSRKKLANELDDNYEYTQYKGSNDINFEAKNKKFGKNDNNCNNNFNKNGVNLEMTKS